MTWILCFKKNRRCRSSVLEIISSFSKTSGRYFKTVTPCFSIQDQLIHLTFVPVFQSKLDKFTLILIQTFRGYESWRSSALDGTTHPNVGYSLCKEQQVVFL